MPEVHNDDDALEPLLRHHLSHTDCRSELLSVDQTACS